MELAQVLGDGLRGVPMDRMACVWQGGLRHVRDLRKGVLGGGAGVKPQNGAANAPHRNLATGVAAVKILAISRVRSGPVIIF